MGTLIYLFLLFCMFYIFLYSSETEQRENEAIQQRRDAEALAETSMLEKDQVGNLVI